MRSLRNFGVMAAAVLAAGTMVAPQQAPAPVSHADAELQRAAPAKAATSDKRAADQPAREARREAERGYRGGGSGSHRFNLRGYGHGFTGQATSAYLPRREDRKHAGAGRRGREARS